jgi:hypothetical protein
VAQGADGQRIGEFASAVMDDPKDFALIRLDPGVAASPEMCPFGGPRGGYTADTADPVVFHYYGNGDAIGSVLPARSGVALGTPHPDHIYAAGLALPGDSGSGLMTADGLAIGVLVTTGLHGVGYTPGPYNTPAPNQKGYFGTMGITPPLMLVRLTPGAYQARMAIAAARDAERRWRGHPGSPAGGQNHGSVRRSAPHQPHWDARWCGPATAPRPAHHRRALRQRGPAGQYHVGGPLRRVARRPQLPRAGPAPITSAMLAKVLRQLLAPELAAVPGAIIPLRKPTTGCLEWLAHRVLSILPVVWLASRWGQRSPGHPVRG